LRKYVVTEDVSTTVPVRKEKARLEREPITDANRDAATSGGDLTEEDHEMTLNEEEVVSDKKVTAKERVRLDKDVEVSDETVSDQVRKEQIEMDDTSNR
jgi:stress response protein YsnF